MRVYADTSFLVRLVAEEPGTDAAMADYHRLGRPAMFYCHCTLWKLQTRFASVPFVFGTPRQFQDGSYQAGN